MTTQPTTASSRSKRALAAKIAGAIGIAICAVIIVVLWLGRGAIAGAIDGLAADVNGGFDRAVAATDAVATRLDEAATNIGSIASDATELASTASPSSDRLAGVQARLGQLGERYVEIRTRYAEVKENVTSARTALRTIGRFVPGVDVPEEPTTVLAGVDEKLQAIDGALTSAWDTVQSASPGSAVANALADRLTALEGFVSSAATAVDGVSARLTTAQTNAANTISNVQTIILIATVAISALLIWVLLLNLALYLLGRGWQRESGSSTTEPPAA